MFVIYGHCASGYTELWDTTETLEAAKTKAKQVLVEYPVTACGTGGVRWVEIIGSDEPEPVLPERDDPDYQAKFDAWIGFEPQNTITLGLSREDNGHWQEA